MESKSEPTENNVIVASEDRDRGILTTADREYLLGAKELATQSERDARFRIRNRIKEALLDFTVLEDGLSSNDRKMVFSEIPTVVLYSAIEFVFKGIVDTSDSVEEALNHFEQIISAGVHSALTELQPEYIISSVEVDINPDQRKPDLEELKRLYLEEDESVSELAYLMRHGEVPGSNRIASIRLMEHLFYDDTLDESQLDMIAPEDSGLSYEQFDDPAGYFEAVKERARGQEGLE